jgi:chaperone LolA
MPNNIAVAAQPSPRRAWMMFFSLVAASLCTLAVRAGAQSAETVYDRAAKVFAAQHNIDAQFEQKITNPLLGRTATSHGRFVQQRPNLVSITFTDPAGDQIVGDGKSLWVYLPSSTPGQALKLPANSDGAIIVVYDVGRRRSRGRWRGYAPGAARATRSEQCALSESNAVDR